MNWVEKTGFVKEGKDCVEDCDRHVALRLSLPVNFNGLALDVKPHLSQQPALHQLPVHCAVVRPTHSGLWVAVCAALNLRAHNDPTGPSVRCY